MTAKPPKPPPALPVGVRFGLPALPQLINQQQAHLRSPLIPGLATALLAANGAPGKSSFGPGLGAAPKPATGSGSAFDFFELGRTCAAMGDYTEAVSALRNATRLDPAMSVAWQQLGDLLRAGGDLAAAESAYRSAALNPMADLRALRQGKILSAGKFAAAERQVRDLVQDRPAGAAELLLRGHLLQAPLSGAGLCVLAELVLAQSRYQEAEALLERALELAPDYIVARHAYAIALFSQGKDAAAVEQAGRLVAAEPADVSYRTLLASSLAKTGRLTRAIEIYAGLVKDAPGFVDIWLSYGQALMHAGRRAESIRIFQTCLSKDPSCGQALWNLDSLQSGQVDPAAIDGMRSRLNDPGDGTENRVYFHYSLASALERQGDYAESWFHYAEGARLWRTTIKYSAEEVSSRVKRAKQVFSERFFAARANFGHTDSAPIFILGMPRAGSTLIEQILASHSEVEGTAELPQIGHIVQAIGRIGGVAAALTYPECLNSLNAASFADMGRRYIEGARGYRSTGKPFFIDKMPGNWLETGLIRLILPQAKIIDARRDPMGNCFAAFKKHFGQGQSFSYDLTELGRYYRDYAELMTHFSTVLPGHVHRVDYESVVENTEHEVRRLLTFCGLEFEPACMRFWETERTVSTVSCEQVRQPIFRGGLDLWRNYAAFLGPLREALGEAA